MLNFVNKLFSSSSQKYLKSFTKTIYLINSFEEKLTKLSDQELQNKTEYFRKLISNN